MSGTTDKSPAKLYQEREKRIEDAIALRIPDRVPVTPSFSFFAARYYGITYKEAMYESAKMSAAWEKTITDFQPDACENPFGTRHVGMLADIVDYKMMKWPGHGVGDNRSFQYLDFENLKADEYDEFLFDPTYFMLTKFWPRVFGSLEAMKNLPSLRMIYSHSGFNALSMLNTPEMDAAFVTLDKIRKQAARNTAASSAYTKKMESLGFPPVNGVGSIVPFDLISDQFRGTRGAMLDMYRQPDKLLAAIDKVLPMIMARAVAAGEQATCKRVFIPLHKGQEFFMSKEQYGKFYWPGFRALMVGLIDAGLNPCPFVEGEYTSRLEFLADIPKGKVCYRFENVDMVRAKDILKGIACIQGGLPITLMCTGSPDDVRTRCKKMIDVVGKGGGYIMDAGVGLDDAKIENIHAMIEFTREYGIY
ncbi:MAG: uroporphyrinogen decarboxylase family protein [Chloroflexota bacterium]